MKDWKWPSAVMFIALLAAIVVMFAVSDDPSTRAHLVGYLDSIVPFVVGAAAGGAVAGITGYARGKGII